MGDLTIKTNGHWYELVSFEELPESARSDFDYVTGEDRYSPRFFRYRRAWHDACEFMVTPATPTNPLEGWQGYQSDSYFSGVVIRHDENFERIQVGTYFS